MTSRVFLLAIFPCLQCLPFFASPNPAAPDQLALGELGSNSQPAHPEPKTLVDVAQGHPVALVHGRASVGFIGRLSDGVSESDLANMGRESIQLSMQVLAVRALPPSGWTRWPSFGCDFGAAHDLGRIGLPGGP